MTPHDRSGRSIAPPPGGGQAARPVSQAPPDGGVQQARRTRQTPTIEELSVATPTLRWVALETFGEQVPLGPNDQVLDSVYNHHVDAWQILLLLQPTEEEAKEE